MQHANDFVTNDFVINVRTEGEHNDDNIEQLKSYSPSLATDHKRTHTYSLKQTLAHASAHSAEHDGSLQESYAVLSITSLVADSEIHMLAGAYTPAPTACHACSPVHATASPLAPVHDSELPSGLYKNNGKPTIDRNFFKSMAKTIKANRTSTTSIAEGEVVDQEACTQYTGYYTSNSCGEETRYLNWIEGDAMRMRIELKFRLIHERMLAPEASNNRRLRR
jgi:hypothetical protein